MKTYSLLMLPGDGIGPEVTQEIHPFLVWFQAKGFARFEVTTDLVGGASCDRHGTPLTPQVLEKARAADATLFGAVGGPRWDDVPYDLRPEAGVLTLRKELKVFANVRPVTCHPSLVEASSLRREFVEGLDLVVVREQSGGTYFDEPKEIVVLEDGEERAVDTTLYTRSQISRIARFAFDLALGRRKQVHSAEKHNVMKTGVLWKRVFTEVHEDYKSDVTLHHILADACAMQLARNPKQFDVIVCDNLFGDILSDQASMLSGSIGMSPSASLGEIDPETGRRPALYEPIHGSAPDIAGQGVANPLAQIACLALCFRHSLQLPTAADMLDRAVSRALAKGFRTPDIMQPNMHEVSTSEMCRAVLKELER